MIRSEIRKARKDYRCERCNRWINKGDRYYFAVASPDHDDLGNHHWWALRECQECTTICGRWPEGIPA